MNTGNNLLYLLVSMVLGLIVVSGILSERSMRGVRVALSLPEEIFAGRPAFVSAQAVNGKRWATSYSLTIEILSHDGPTRRVYVPRLRPGEAHLFTWQETARRRGRGRLAGIRITTLFPFGLFVKAGRPLLDSEILVFPSVDTALPAALRRTDAGGSAVRQRGRGNDLYNLREYRWGDDPRLIHWRSTAKTGALVVRELEAETTADARIVLDGTGARDAGRLEAGLSLAASLATHLIDSGGSVELAGAGVHVALGRGRPHLRSILTALALYEPGHGPEGNASLPAPPPLRELRVALD